MSVSIFQDYRLVATHLRCRRAGERRTHPDHLPPDARAFFAHDRYWCLEQALRVGPACTALIEQLLSDRIVERLRAAQNVLYLANPYGRVRLEAACARALAHASLHYRTVKTILAGGHDLKPLDPAHRDPQFVYGRHSRFHRDAASLFGEDEGTRH